jgi:uncharacterized integral membrane protein (TIGR00698 family)
MRLVPGVALCVAITLAARAIQTAEVRLFGHPFVEAIVLAILLGTALRTLWTPGARWKPGIDLSARLLLEIAVVLLGASVSFRAVAAAGPALFAGIIMVVAFAIAASYGVSRALGLSRRLSMLVACGNSICGNSAIAAVAPVIGADEQDVASAIAFTAILGVIVVLALPLLIPVLGLSFFQYGVLAGLTVYAVPQVLAATMPVSAISSQIGTLVKLVRVLMLGPVVLALSLRRGRADRATASAGELAVSGAESKRTARRPLVPWFILGFLALATARSVGLLSDGLVQPLAATAGLLTVISMAALGLGVDVRAVARVGGRVTMAVTASLIVLLAISAGLIRLLRIA